jgi:hypothetical protein
MVLRLMYGGLRIAGHLGDTYWEGPRSAKRDNDAYERSTAVNQAKLAKARNFSVERTLRLWVLARCRKS